MAKKARENDFNSSTPYGDEEDAKLTDFVGKECSFFKAVRWAHKNRHFYDVKPTDAPSQEAWAWLLDFREGGIDFVQAVMPRCAPRQAPEEEEKKNTLADYEGKQTYDFYDRIIREKMS
jgi:hypothetical protein